MYRYVPITTKFPVQITILPIRIFVFRILVHKLIMQLVPNCVHFNLYWDVLTFTCVVIITVSLNISESCLVIY
jgi:uncharacterized membrane protein